MTFSQAVKSQIIRQQIEQENLPSLLCGAVLSSGSLVLSESGVSFELVSENKEFISFTKKLISIFLPQTKITISEGLSFKQKNKSELRVDSLCGRQILTNLGIISFDKQGNFEICRTGASHLIYEEKDKLAFLKGLFLGAGSVSIPGNIDINDLSKSTNSSGYHMEWSLQSNEQAQTVIALLAEHDIICRQVERGDNIVVYIKEAESISSILGLFGAHKAVLELENQRAGRQMRNLVNRQANCIAANIDKSINAALKQLEAIETIRKTVGLESLPESLLEVATARLANPEGSLKEIGEVLGGKISKAAISQKFKKLIEIAKEINL